ncbi:MAG: transporter substrate-binding domain-containing protein, partial [Leptospiraceae bacterium]|nr:transporter substrate-binding domain-containing protein [Leptospiraceae bacterium]
FLVKKKDVSILFFLQNFFGETFIYAIGALLSLLFLFGNLLFLAERKTNPAFQHGYIKSVGNGIWLSIVTFSTVGYGDIIPRTRLGRLVIATWMITSMITASSLTAGIAASFTVTNLKNNPIDTLDKIRDKKIAAITGSTAVEVVKENKGKIIEVSSIKEGFLKVKVEESDAYLGDFPILKYNLQFDYFEGADILPISSEKDKYGFCLPRNSKHFFRINRTLLRMEEDETISLILQKWGI